MICEACGSEFDPLKDGYCCLDTVGLEGEACPPCHRVAWRRARGRDQLVAGASVPRGIWAEILDEGGRAG